MIPGAVAGADELAGRDQPRARHVAFVDGPAQVRPDGGAQALGGGDAGLQHLPRLAGGAQRPVGLALRRQGADVVRRHAEEVHVGIDHARHNRLVAPVDHKRIGGRLDRVAMPDLVNSAVQDEHRGVFLCGCAGAVEHASGLEEGRSLVVRHCLTLPVARSASGPGPAMGPPARGHGSPQSRRLEARRLSASFSISAGARGGRREHGSGGVRRTKWWASCRIHRLQCHPEPACLPLGRGIGRTPSPAVYHWQPMHAYRIGRGPPLAMSAGATGVWGRVPAPENWNKPKACESAGIVIRWMQRIGDRQKAEREEDRWQHRNCRPAPTFSGRARTRSSS